MKKWILLAVFLTAGGAIALLDRSGKIDLASSFEQAKKQVGQVATTLSDDEAHAATAKQKKATTTTAPAVSVATVKSEKFVEEILVIGSLTARQEILISPEIEGFRIVSLAVEEGDTVTEGQLLASLEQETLLAQMAQNDASLARADAAVAQAQSRIAEAEAVLAEAKSQLNRAKPLNKRRILSDSVYDQRQTAERTAQAQLRSARDGVTLAKAERALIQAERRGLEWRLSKTKIKAPVDGLITRRTARIGDLGSISKTPLFRLAENGEIELQAAVTETKLALMAPGQKAKVEVAGAGTVDGLVRLVSPEIDPATRLGNVRIFLGDDPKLRIGAFGRGNIVASRSVGLAIPLAAVLFDGNKAYVQKVVEGRVKSTPVTLGLTSKDRVEIKNGLSEGEVVVAKAGSFLRDGDAVRPILGNQRLTGIR